MVICPEWLVILVQINPLTYAVDVLRGTLIHFHQFPPMLGPIIIAAMAVGFFVLALFNFPQVITMSERPWWVGDLITLAGIAALFGGVYLLPPDTSLAEVKRTGALAVCVPTLYPPLVTGQPEAPGFDVEFVQAIARRLGVIMVDNANVARGRVSEALLARQISGTLDLQIAWMPEPLVRYPVAFGLWKGDLTLKRRLGEVIDELESEGLTRELSSRYRIAPIEATLRLN